jgi:hypothetical protein
MYMKGSQTHVHCIIPALGQPSRALLTLKIFAKIVIVAFSFIFNKYYLIIDSLGSKDSSSRKLQTNYVISYYFIYI